jgi:seryl-tRNA synthetase
MLDIKFIRENAGEIKEAAKNKNIDLDLDLLLELEEKRRNLQTKIDELRAARNEIAKAGKGQKPTPEQIEEGKRIKTELGELEESFKKIDADFLTLMVKVPTIPSEDTPIGKSDEENKEIFSWGEKTKFDFEPKDHVELAENLDILDFKRGTKVAGYRGYYVKNEGVQLQMALMIYGLTKLISKGFTPIIPPTIVREFALFGSGYFAGKEYNPEVDEIYKIENDEKEADGSVKKESKFLIGTSEPSLLAYYANEVLEEKELPIKFCGFSPCYRSEIGSYGKDTKGIYRVHEFMKVEQVCICPADDKIAEEIHEEIVNISKEIHEELGIPYRQLAICTGDMSAGKFKMYDLEAWMPGRGEYGETGSASNFKDWQSRRLNIKYNDQEGNRNFVYMLNNTAIPSPRMMIAIMENYQQVDGSIKIPEVLQPFMNGIKVIKAK